MSEHYGLGITLIVLGGIANGLFALPMRFSRRWQWENTWLTFTMLALLVLPWVLLAGFSPHVGDLYHSAPWHLLLYPLVFGFLWGIAQVTFGLSINAIGMAIAFAVVQGVQTPVGSLVPLLVFDSSALFHSRGLRLLAGLPVLLLGLILYAMAGRRREGEQTASKGHSELRKGSFIAGLAIAVFTGIFGANLNLGFAFGGGLIHRSLQLGANSATATYCVWALVLGAGFIPNLLYCGFLLSRNRTWNLFGAAGWLKESVLSIAMSALWLGGILLYGFGATLAGRYGTSAGFVLMVAVVVITASAAGVLTGEWKSVSYRTKQLLTVGMAAILLSVAVISFGNPS